MDSAGAGRLHTPPSRWARYAVVPHAEPEAEALRWAWEINGKSPTAQRMLKYAFNLVDDGLAGQQLFAGEKVGARGPRPGAHGREPRAQP